MRTKGELKKAYPKLNQLIDSLWRNYYGLYAERYRDPADLDGAGDPIDEWQKNFISRDIRHGQAIGQNNLVEGNRSIAIGQSNTTKSFLEIVCGVYATAPAQNATEWVPADRLFTVGNGLGDALRNDALTIYKSGYSKFTNALLVGDYDHRDEIGFLIDPVNGTLRFTTANKYQFWDVDHWASFGGGSGTVTSFSASGITGLFTTSVATPTTTPALSFALVSKNANRVFASPDSAAGVPSFRQIVAADLSATGTPSATTFLTGNWTWSGITKAMVEAVLTGAITSHTHNYTNYSGWNLNANSGTPVLVDSGNTVNFIQGSNITISRSGQNITIAGSAGSMVYPGAGLAKSTGSAWDTSITDNSSNWNAAYTHKTTEDALNGLVKVNGAGVYSAITDNSSNWNAAYTHKTTEDALNGLVKVNGAGVYSAVTDNSSNWNEAYANMGKVAFHDNATLIGYLNSSNFSIAGGVISLKLKTINSTSLIGIGDLSLQPTLTSGTNIKTINGNSILGSGDITITGGTNYWQTGTGWIAPATLADEVRIGAITDMGDYKLQVSGGIRNQDAFYSDGVITLIHHENTTSPNRVINLHATATQGWSYSRECAIAFNTPPTASSDVTIESGLFTNYLNTATPGSRTSHFKWYLLHNDTLTNTMTLNNLGDLSVTGKLTAASTILSSGGAIGYATGAGSTATQGTSKATAVTCNALCGDITTFSAALAAAAEATFTVNNNKVLAGDIVIVNHVSGGTNGAYLVSVTAVASGSFSITYSNVSTASKTESPVFRFAIFRAVTS